MAAPMNPLSIAPLTCQKYYDILQLGQGLKSPPRKNITLLWKLNLHKKISYSRSGSLDVILCEYYTLSRIDNILPIYIDAFKISTISLCVSTL